MNKPLYKIRKPSPFEALHTTPVWIPEMDQFIGRPVYISKWNKTGNIYTGANSCWLIDGVTGDVLPYKFHTHWLEPIPCKPTVEEVNKIELVLSRTRAQNLELD